MTILKLHKHIKIHNQQIKIHNYKKHQCINFTIQRQHQCTSNFTNCKHTLKIHTFINYKHQHTIKIHTKIHTQIHLLLPILPSSSYGIDFHHYFTIKINSSVASYSWGYHVTGTNPQHFKYRYQTHKISNVAIQIHIWENIKITINICNHVINQQKNHFSLGIDLLKLLELSKRCQSV